MKKAVFAFCRQFLKTCVLVQRQCDLPQPCCNFWKCPNFSQKMSGILDIRVSTFCHSVIKLTSLHPQPVFIPYPSPTYPCSNNNVMTWFFNSCWLEMKYSMFNYPGTFDGNWKGLLFVSLNWFSVWFYLFRHRSTVLLVKSYICWRYVSCFLTIYRASKKNGPFVFA